MISVVWLQTVGRVCRRGALYGWVIGLGLLFQACAVVPERKALDLLPPIPDAGPGKNAALRVQRGLEDVESGHLERAVQYFSDALTFADLTVTERAMVLNNRGVVQGRLGLFEEALADFSAAIQLRKGQSGKALYNRGTTYFLLGEFALAAADLGPFVRQNPKRNRSPYPMLWLYLAQSRAGLDGRSGLAEGCSLAWSDEVCQRRSGRFVSMDWPGPLFALHLEQISPETLLKKIPQGETDRHHQEHLCDAYFHLGEYYLLKREWGLARKWWQMAVDTRMTHLNEHTAAAMELQRSATWGGFFSSW